MSCVSGARLSPPTPPTTLTLGTKACRSTAAMLAPRMHYGRAKEPPLGGATMVLYRMGIAFRVTVGRWAPTLLRQLRSAACVCPPCRSVQIRRLQKALRHTPRTSLLDCRTAAPSCPRGQVLSCQQGQSAVKRCALPRTQKPEASVQKGGAVQPLQGLPGILVQLPRGRSKLGRWRGSCCNAASRRRSGY